MNDNTASDLAQNGAPDHTTAASATNGLAGLIGRTGQGLVEGDEFFRQLLNALPAAVYATDADGFVVYYNDAAAVIWGCRPELGKARWCGSWRLFWPDGRELPHEDCPMAIAVRDQEAVRGLEAVVERPDGSRISLIPHPTPIFSASGTFLGALNLMVDISENKRHEAQLAVLAREAEHRSKNVLATVSATVQLSQADTPEALKKVISGRIQALAHAHALFVETRWQGADLESLVAEELAPFCQGGEGRTRFAGPFVMLEPNLAQCIAVSLHELATNAAKYGALSVSEGQVDLTWSRPSIDAVLIRWVESGGPHVKKPGRTGFGTRVMQTMMQQSNGEIVFDWRAEGLVCELRLSA
jgi:PAS domain S-box-containing protein